MENVEKVVDVAAEATEGAVANTRNWKVIGIVAGVTLLTGGVGFGIYKLIKSAKAKKAAKAAEVEANTEATEESK